MTTTIDREGNGDTPIGDIGGFVNWWAASRVYVRSDLRYIRIKPTDNTAESVTEGSASFTYYPWRHLGVWRSVHLRQMPSGPEHRVDQAGRRLVTILRIPESRVGAVLIVGASRPVMP
jgi:hypothetical protein